MQAVSDEFGNIVARERRENDLVNQSLRSTNCTQDLHQGVRRADFIVAIRANYEKVADVGMRNDVLEQLEGRSVEPLEIVKKDDERMLLIGEHAQKGSECHMKTGLRFRGWKLRNRRLSTNDELDLGDEVHDELPIRANGLAYRTSPTVDLRLIFAQGQRGIWNIPLLLVEFSEDEESARQDDCFVKFVHDRRLADPGIAGDQQQCRRTGGDHLVESGEQSLAFPVTAV
jgi:hypothetical protein